MDILIHVTGDQRIAHRVKAWRAEQLKGARLSAGLTQVQLARLVEVEQNTISRFENATSAPNLEMQLKLSVALGVDVDDLFGFPYGTMDIARFEHGNIAPDEAA